MGAGFGGYRKGGRIIAVKSVSERNAVEIKSYFMQVTFFTAKLRPYLLKMLVAPADGICTSEIVPFRVFGASFQSMLSAT